jgi:hypothetical protein
MPIVLCALALGTFLGFAASAAPADDVLVGLNWHGQVDFIDPATGQVFADGDTGLDRLNSLARDPRSGALYAARTEHRGTSPFRVWLVLIDPETGVATLGPELDEPIDVRGLAFVDGELLAVHNFSIAERYELVEDTLVRIDPATGAVAWIGSTGLPDLQSLDVSPRGVLYSWSFELGLVTVDPRTGLARDVDPTVGGEDELPAGGHGIQALVFSPRGILYGAWEQLFVFDTTTGAATLVGGRYTDVRGLAYLSDAIQIDLDVRPHQARDHVNTRSRGLLPVAILGTPGLDVREVDVSTLGFGPGQARVEKRPKLRDVTRDGELDLIVRFRSNETGLEPGAGEACMEGALLDGTPLFGCAKVAACGLGFEAALGLLLLARARAGLRRAARDRGTRRG